MAVEVQRYLDQIKEAKAQAAEAKNLMLQAQTETRRLLNLADKLKNRIVFPAHVALDIAQMEAGEFLEYLAQRGPQLKPTVEMERPDALDESARAKQSYSPWQYARG